jgi:L-threonylcarbamoyladenylate synthase
VPQPFKLATDAIKSGRVVLFPTESFWALGVDATNVSAIQHLFRVKHREWAKPFALVAADLEQVEKFFYMSSRAKRLARKHWPGPLTILLKPRRRIAAHALGSDTIGVRVPSHRLARRLAHEAGVPITATSANVTGRKPSKSLARIKRTFPAILAIPGRCGKQRLPSTIVRCENQDIKIIRPGAIHV